MLVVPFRTQHLEVLKIQTIQQYVLDQAGALEPYGKYLEGGDAFSGFDVVTGEMAGCAGVMQIHDGLGQAWALMADINKYKRHLFVEIRKYLDRVLDEEHKFNRVQMSVLEDHEEGERFAKHLGFEKECLMKYYGKWGENHWLYSRTTKNSPKYRITRSKK